MLGVQKENKFNLKYLKKLFEKVKLASETCTIALVQAGMQSNQIASVIDRAGNITNFTVNCTGKNFFFCEDSKEACP